MVDPALERRLVTAGSRSLRPSSEADRRLLALAAVFTPSCASALLSRLEPPEAAWLSAEAAAAAATSRRARLEALAKQIPRGQEREAVEALAASERPPTAAAIRAALGGAVSRGVTRAFLRLLQERASDGRTVGRAAHPRVALAWRKP